LCEKFLGLKFLVENLKHNDLWSILRKASCCFDVVEDKVIPNYRNLWNILRWNCIACSGVWVVHHVKLSVDRNSMPGNLFPDKWMANCSILELLLQITDHAVATELPEEFIHEPLR
jgi:hypothetical protein